MVNSEADIQNRLYRELHRRHPIIVPNTTLFGWEADLVSVNPNGFLCEYEIKISRSDFKADSRKYQHVTRVSGEVGESGPSYFYYVTPRDLVTVDEVPVFAGLIYSHPILQYVKKAPKLHRTKVTDNQRNWLIRGLAYRYWKYRLNEKPLATQ